MMKIFIPFLSILFLSYSGYAQSGIEVYGLPLDSLKTWVEQDPAHFDDLRRRIVEGDTSLTPDDYILIYYSSAFMDGYSPYAERINRGETIELINEGKIDKAIKLGEGMIADQPAFAGAYLDVGIAYKIKGDSLLYDSYVSRYYSLLRVPFHSGKGDSPETAFVVRSVDDEYLLIDELDYYSMGQALISEEGIPYDVLTVAREEDKSEEPETDKLYFNIYQPFKIGMASMFSDVKEEVKEVGETKGKKKKRSKKKRKKEKG